MKRARVEMPFRTPAGFFAINEFYGWATCAGGLAHCALCNCEARLPLPRDGEGPYNEALARFLAQHKHSGGNG